MKIHESDAPVWEIQKNYSGNSRKKKSFMDDPNNNKKEKQRSAKKRKKKNADFSERSSLDSLSLSEYSQLSSLSSLSSIPNIQNIQSTPIPNKNQDPSPELKEPREPSNEREVNEREVNLNGFVPTQLLNHHNEANSTKNQKETVPKKTSMNSIKEKETRPIHFDGYA